MQLIKQLPNLNEKNKERPLCFHYSIKARALIHAHLSRMQLPENTLELDRQLVARKSPYLIQEMVTCVSQLIMLAHAGRSKLPKTRRSDNFRKFSLLCSRRHKIHSRFVVPSQLEDFPHWIRLNL